MGLRLVLPPLSLSFYLPLHPALGTVTRDWHLRSPAMALFAPDTSRMTKGVVPMRADIAQAPATPESSGASMQGPPLQADAFLSSTICYHRASTWAHSFKTARGPAFSRTEPALPTPSTSKWFEGTMKMADLGSQQWPRLPPKPHGFPHSGSLREAWETCQTSPCPWKGLRN